jgi:hypothetical protein
LHTLPIYNFHTILKSITTNHHSPQNTMATPTESENQLLIAVLSQLSTTGINYKVLAGAIGSPTPEAARMRWSRYSKKILGGKPAGSSPSKPAGITKSAKKAGVKIGSPTKKAKRKAADDELETEESMMDIGTTEDDELPVTPKRSSPKRKASERIKEVVKMYKEETGSEGEEEPEVEVAADEEEEFGVEMEDIKA